MPAPLGCVVDTGTLTETLDGPAFGFEHTYAERLDGLYEPWRGVSVPEPRLLLLNEDLAGELGLDASLLRSPAGVAILAGAATAADSRPIAQAYSGHQFGGLSPRLGDGRALLLGELIDREGRRRDLHLKGSGRTPFSRGGDGKAAVGPVLREYLMGEAMWALGIPTTRALAVVATGEDVLRDRVLPGAVLARVAASHLRVGTFQYAALHGGPDQVARLVDYAIERHHPAAASAERPALALLEAVCEAQAQLVARWMLVGFIHGVMNTDNTTISGETIDYGPCAFMDRFDPATVFSSIDHGGRYAYGNQPRIAQWNLARLAETLLPLIDEDDEAAVARATSVLEGFVERYSAAWVAGVRPKLGLVEPAEPSRARDEDDAQLATDLLDVLGAGRADHTGAFRSLSAVLRGDEEAATALGDDAAATAAWIERWRGHRADDPRPVAEVAEAMDRANPVYIPRNHLVEEALEAATDHDDLDPLRRLLDVLARPFEERPGLERYAEAAPPEYETYQTFCGT